MSRRKPEHLKVLEGHDSDESSPCFEPIEESPPDFTEILGEGQVADEASEEWRRVYRLLKAAGVLAASDAALLEEYALVWARLRDVERTITREGLTVKGYRDSTVKHPLSTVGNAYRQQLRVYIRELGLGPASRRQLDVLPTGQAEGMDPLDELQIQAAVDRITREHGARWRAHLPEWNKEQLMKATPEQLEKVEEHAAARVRDYGPKKAKSK